MLLLKYLYTRFRLVLIIFFKFLMDFILFFRFLINVGKGLKMAENARNVGKMTGIQKPVQNSKKIGPSSKRKEIRPVQHEPDRPVQLNRFTNTPSPSTFSFTLSLSPRNSSLRNPSPEPRNPPSLEPLPYLRHAHSLSTSSSLSLFQHIIPKTTLAHSNPQTSAHRKHKPRYHPNPRFQLRPTHPTTRNSRPKRPYTPYAGCIITIHNTITASKG